VDDQRPLSDLDAPAAGGAQRIHVESGFENLKGNLFVGDRLESPLRPVVAIGSKTSLFTCRRFH
jgi:hypothetical protein